MPKYHVRLTYDTTRSADVIVEADSEDEASDVAWERRREVEYRTDEFGGDPAEAEVQFAELADNDTQPTW